MPLQDGCSKDIVHSNIRKMIAEGAPRRQAIAIALSHQRRTCSHAGRRRRGRASGGAWTRPRLEKAIAHAATHVAEAPYRYSADDVRFVLARYAVLAPQVRTPNSFSEAVISEALAGAGVLAQSKSGAFHASKSVAKVVLQVLDVQVLDAARGSLGMLRSTDRDYQGMVFGSGIFKKRVSFPKMSLGGARGVVMGKKPGG